MNIVLGVTGGIAAFKTIQLANDLTKDGHSVKVVLTEHAQEFVRPLTYESLTKEEVVCDMFSSHNSEPINHIALAQWADILIIAPATANIIAKMAHGIADDFLSTLYLATEAQILIAPAMNTKMYLHPQTQKNISSLEEIGAVILEAEQGQLACGDYGVGKMVSPDVIRIYCNTFRKETESLKGTRILISAGPTRESFDPVRFVTNHSSGKMGYALANAAVSRGATVTLISGPSQEIALPGIQVVHVTTTLEMLDALESHIESHDALIMAAAPSDYRPATYSNEKRKKSDHIQQIDLTPNPDILKTLANKKNNKIFIGFAAESEQILKHATKKLKEKSLDYIVANDISGDQTAFKSDYNQATIISANGEQDVRQQESKVDLAHAILDKLSH